VVENLAGTSDLKKKKKRFKYGGKKGTTHLEQNKDKNDSRLLLLAMQSRKQWNNTSKVLKLST
jgi:hypothetical protein